YGWVALSRRQAGSWGPHFDGYSISDTSLPPPGTILSAKMMLPVWSGPQAGTKDPTKLQSRLPTGACGPVRATRGGGGGGGRGGACGARSRGHDAREVNVRRGAWCEGAERGASHVRQSSLSCRSCGLPRALYVGWCLTNSFSMSRRNGEGSNMRRRPRQWRCRAWLRISRSLARVMPT